MRGAFAELPSYGEGGSPSGDHRNTAEPGLRLRISIECPVLRVGWAAPGDGQHLRTITLPYQPISTYWDTVAWSVSIADQMAYPIHVVPLNYDDIRNTGRFKPICEAVASMTDQEARRDAPDGDCHMRGGHARL